MLRIVGSNGLVGVAVIAIAIWSTAAVKGQTPLSPDAGQIHSSTPAPSPASSPSPSPTSTPVPAPVSSASPAPSPSPTPSLEREFVKNVVKDQKAIWTSPFHLHREDAKWMIPMGVGLMALFTTDRMTGDAIAKSHGQLTTSRIVSYGGAIYGVGTAASAFYILGRRRDDRRMSETGILIAEAGIDGLIVSAALKGITQRGRPRSGTDRSEFFEGGTSFPSGHTIGAFTTATIIADEYHGNRKVAIAAYGLATAVGLARFTGENHYLSDILAGGAIGFGIGQYVYHTRHHEKRDLLDEDGARKSSLWPNVEPEYNHRERKYAVAMEWHF
jgi:hypothetical protein